MKFSVIIPAYNSEAYIGRALDSITSQSFTDYELIVVCDSCIDKTEDIAKDAGAKTIRINAHNDGMARNAGLDAAQGDFVLFLDDDDWYLHEFAFELLANRIRDYDAQVYCFSFIWKGVKYASPFSNNGTLYPAVWNKCWLRSFIGDTRFPNIYSISDYHFHMAMLAKCPVIDDWDMPLVYYNYLRPGSISDQMGRTIEHTKKYWEEH